MRINKFIAQSGMCSRRKAEEFIKNEQVKVNGETITNLATDINEKKDEVIVDGNKISISENYVYFMLNKPKGYLTTLSDDRNRKTIKQFMSDLDDRVYPVGRLDYDSEGLLFLTNDGDLTYKLTHPKFAITKTYIVKVEGQVKESELAVLRAGVVVDGEKFNKCKVRILDYRNKITKLEVILNEGKNREIRKMFDCIGKQVIFLKRVEMAGIKLGGLMRGEKRPLKDYEIEYLHRLTKFISQDNK